MYNLEIRRKQQKAILILKDVRGHCSRASSLRTLARATQQIQDGGRKQFFSDNSIFCIVEVETISYERKNHKKEIEGRKKFLRLRKRREKERS